MIKERLFITPVSQCSKVLYNIMRENLKIYLKIKIINLK